ncbi:NAD(P)/FAD-dependent oxidoreductase [Thalassomonas sp. M1454]|uniref:NAD(P)/FAD-dependent oxidoreductase n=1 Tax=Thalassomonas sp. M1454 TaxID=2594477 RepID=UPI00117CEC9D|nr:FAD-dependent oxidoreductase [Thalassomonas sp. M1454]TRX54993.1 FAD-dependent oxidoreductase [Thalassomonas sp. M1454]
MKNIAIIGSGISGLTSAYLLSQKHKVTVFEKNDYIGGHTATVDVELNNKNYVVDTGFIVFNNKTYPNFLKLLKNIGIGKQESEMSFAVHNCQTGLEYNGNNLDTLFVQRRNLFRPKFWQLILQILKFNKLCKQAYNDAEFNDEQTLGDFLDANGFNEFFANHYILPMGAAIWSSSLEQMQSFQFKFFVQFFNNHGLLNISDRPQWYVIPNGSRSYITPMIKNFADNIELNSEISKVTRENEQVQIHFSNGDVRVFDEVVFACHSDQALALLADTSHDEQQILGAMQYKPNDVVLHTDTSLLPKRRKTWASWNYQLSDNRTKPASVTYNMNILQSLNSDTTFCVTLNQNEDIDESKILRKFVYHHPVFNVQSLNAQQQRQKICGQNHTHFTGAYWYNGFHEDGVRSAVDVGAKFGCEL